MKSIIIISLVSFTIFINSSAVAFVTHGTPPITGIIPANPPYSSSSLSSSAKLEMTPELEIAIADVREAAAAFGEKTAHFANVWIDRTIEGKRDGTAAGLLEECVLDDDDEGKCERFTNALTKLDNLLGVGAAEQY